ncbi:PIN domain-containing protein [Pseudonocardia sp. DSM 110487]|uniref:type II toxin-antitoxin system VapC family toxin n=1 Tax=Pseudonocardia sp. DSM 110487 TaxID=2865833 RepID=UPI001C6993E2|nr:PIN domain-containing protein [Pseudonocardia sp. DSM 110487]QYN34934.1 PIN domain-containing protein [Pseudonocardia sp. DSM 110487]
MTTKVADRVVLDTNVLLTATDAGRAEYAKAREALDEWPARGTTLYTSGQILREYLSVATRPEERNGLGLSQQDSVANARALCGRLRLLDENEKVNARLLALLDDIGCGGKQVHDANIVATMLVHGVDTLVTGSVEDFTRFERLITVRKL